MPCLSGTSTVDFTSLYDSVNVTIVPSGTAFPLQSRTGSVCSWTLSPDALAFIFRLQGSPGTWPTTRSLDTLPTCATNRSFPPRDVESISIQAAPSRVCTVRVCAGVDGLDNSNDTCTGVVIRFL